MKLCVYLMEVIIGILANSAVLVVYALDKRIRKRSMTQLVLHLTIADLVHLISSIQILRKLTTTMKLDLFGKKVNLDFEECFSSEINHEDLTNTTHSAVTKSETELASHQLRMHLKIGSGLLLLDHFFFYLGFFASIVILTFMAVDRVLLIVCKTGKSQMKHLVKEKSYFSVVLVWLISTTTSILFVWLENVPCPDTNHHVSLDTCALLDLKYGSKLGRVLGENICEDPCSIEFSADYDYEYESLNPEATLPSIIGLFAAIFLLVIPALVIPVSYFLIVRRVRNSAHLTGRFQSDDKINKLVVMVITMVSIFLLCWTPFFIATVYEKASNEVINSELYQIVSCLPYISSMCNPFIYSIFSSKFKESLARIFTPKKSESFLLRTTISMPVTETQ